MIKDDKEQPGKNSSGEPELFSRVAGLLRRHVFEDKHAETVDHLKQAWVDLEQYCLEHPTSVAAMRLAAECAFQLEQIPKARKYILQAESIEPWNSEILIISESLYEYESQQRVSITPVVFQSTIPFGAVNAEKLLKKAMGWFQLGQFERSYSLAKLCFAMNPVYEHILLQIVAIGSCFDPQRLYRELAVLLDLQILTPYLFLSLGSVCNVLGQYEMAAKWLSDGLDLNPRDPYLMAMLLNELAYVMAKQGKSLDQCAFIARSALETFPDRKTNGFIRDTLGFIYLKKGDVQKAIRNFREAVSKDQTVIPRFHLSIALLKDGQIEDALHELKNIAGARPSFDSPHAEEMVILDRVQGNLKEIEYLLRTRKDESTLEALKILQELL